MAELTTNVTSLFEKILVCCNVKLKKVKSKLHTDVLKNHGVRSKALVFPLAVLRPAARLRIHKSKEDILRVLSLAMCPLILGHCHILLVPVLVSNVTANTT